MSAYLLLEDGTRAASRFPQGLGGLGVQRSELDAELVRRCQAEPRIDARSLRDFHAIDERWVQDAEYAVQRLRKRRVRSIDRERLLLAHCQQSGQMVDVAVRQKCARDRRLARRAARVQCACRQNLLTKIR